jgi:formylglycine-generating enzyme required for sulfatase activity
MKMLGDYEILGEMGQSASGTLYRAEHRFLKRPFAIKVLPQELALDPAFIARFETAISALAKLDHPHIVKVHDVSYADGLYFLVADSLSQEMVPLAHFLKERAAPLEEELLIQIAQQAASALDYAHGHSLIHRGFKLSNLLISATKEGVHLMLSDFGLLPIVGHDRFVRTAFEAVENLLTEKSLTSRDKASLEALHFLAPEQRERAASSDEKVDQYAFGVLLYRLIMGYYPEGAFEMPQSTASHIKLNWDPLLLACLQRSFDKRPSQLVQAMDELLFNAQKGAALKPRLKPQEIVRPEFEPDPGAIFQTESSVGRYQPKQAELKSHDPIETEMIVINESNFERGSNRGGRDEMPRHTIHLSSFALDVHPVTNEQFVRFLEVMGGEKDGNNCDMIRLKESRVKRSGGSLSIESGFAKHPIVGVTWYGAVAYAKWVGKRLPTEAEWEVAAYGGSADATYPTGRDIDRSKANFFSSDTTPVMSYPPNGYGLYDMAGNVYEWCQDWYDYHYYNLSVQEPNNPKGPLQGVYRVLRGGCWKSLKEDLCCSHRHRNNPGTMNGTYGFRCAADVS